MVEWCICIAIFREPTPAAGTTKQPLKISESGEFDNLVSGPANPKALGVEKRKLQGLIPDRPLLDHAVLI